MNIKPRGKYVDAFVIPVKKSNLEDYLKLAKKCSKIWLEHGAIEYVECVGTNIFMDYGTPFPKLAKLKKDEVCVFSWIVYKSMANQKSVMKKVLSDKRLAQMQDPKNMPFDMNKMSHGGFSMLVTSKKNK